MAGRLFTPGDPILSEKEIARLEQVGQTLVRPKGTVFMAEGEESDFVLLILKGYMKIVMGQPRRTVALRRAGETVGEMAPIDLEPRSATVIAASDVVVLWISGDQWLDFLSKNPRAHMAQTYQAQQRAKQASQKLVESDFTVERKLAKALLELAEFEGVGVDDGTVRVAAGQQELAELAGASIDAIKKAIRNFKARGLLSTGRQWTTLNQVDQLRLIAENRGVAP